MPGRRIQDLGEHPWLARLIRRLRGRSRRVLVGPGDDAAVLRPGTRPLLFTTDSLVEGVHFRHAWLSPAALGRRAFAVNASDIAAMGGVPTAAVLAVVAPRATPVADLDGLVAGVAAAARRAGADLVGGNLGAGPRLIVTIALLGEAPGRVVTRSGARPGDLLVVTGPLGRAGTAVRRLLAGGSGRLPAPPSRLHAGEALARVAHAMIDVSDGLVQDVGHLCRASRVAATIELARVPVAPECRRRFGAGAPAFAATAGEDYELVAAIPPSALAGVRASRGFRLTVIGGITRGRPAVRLLDAEGHTVRTPRGGFDHFR